MLTYTLKCAADAGDDANVLCCVRHIFLIHSLNVFLKGNSRMNMKKNLKLNIES